jgi:predicted P-loop ATPase
MIMTDDPRMWQYAEKLAAALDYESAMAEINRANTSGAPAEQAAACEAGSKAYKQWVAMGSPNSKTLRPPGPIVSIDTTLPVKPAERVLPLNPPSAHTELMPSPNDGRFEASLNNVLLALRSNQVMEIIIRKDSFLDQIVVTINGTSREVKDVDYIRLRSWLEGAHFKPVSQDLMRHAVMMVAEDNKFDSAIDWLNTLVWDGVPRVDAFFERYFGIEGGDYPTACGRYLWTSLAGRTLVPGIQADMALVLIGGQGLHKTKAIKALVRSHDLYVEIDLGDDDADQARKMRGKQVAEIAELRGLKTRDAEHIKAFISRTVDEWTPKYVEHASKLLRRVVFIGTGNDDEFLNDPTGNRRWLPMTLVRPVDLEAIARDRDQLWAEGAVLFKSQGIAWQDAQRLAEDEHGDYEVEDTWAQPIAQWLSKPDGWIPNVPADRQPNGPPRGALPFTAGDVLQGALRLDPARINRAAEMRAAIVLKKLGYRGTRTYVNGVQVRVWKPTIPPRPPAVQT